MDKASAIEPGAAAAMTEPRQPAEIDWSYSGAPDPMSGTGANAAELSVIWLVGFAGAGIMLALHLTGSVPWTLWQTGLAALIAFDLIGGAAAAALNSSKRFYFSPPKANERGALRLLKTGYYLPAISVHPILVYLVFKPEAVLTGIAIYFAIGLVAILVRLAPLYLARPLGTISVIAAILLSAYVLRAPPGFEWLLPMLALKLILGHSVREEPYRPSVHA